MIEPALAQQADAFAAEITSLLHDALPGAPAAIAEVVGDRVVVSTADDVPLFVHGIALAQLGIRLRCQLDTQATWLAIDTSQYVLTATLDRTPLLRFEYVRKSRTAPHAHIQIHAHRGAFTHLLSRSGRESPHDLSSLHLPVGGSRLRPCLEDVVQFLIEECGFDSLPDWHTAVDLGRADWRRKQVRALVRDFQAEAVGVLEDAGYRVEAPAAGIRESPEKALHAW